MSNRNFLWRDKLWTSTAIQLFYGIYWKKHGENFPWNDALQAGVSVMAIVLPNLPCLCLNFWLQACILSGTFHATFLLFTNWRRHWWVEDLRILQLKNNCRLLCIVSSWLEGYSLNHGKYFWAKNVLMQEMEYMFESMWLICVNSSIRWAYTCVHRHVSIKTATVLQRYKPSNQGFLGLLCSEFYNKT